MTETNITPIAHKPPIVVLREKLQERRPELQAALTDIDPDHFIRALITAANQSRAASLLFPEPLAGLHARLSGQTSA